MRSSNSSAVALLLVRYRTKKEMIFPFAKSAKNKIAFRFNILHHLRDLITFALKLGFQTSISLREVLGIIPSADTENEVY